MDLLTVSVTGFKRFRATTSLQTNGKLVAVLGPNEAGKSTLLAAIAHLGDNREFDPEDTSRDASAEDTRIVGRFYLSADDLEAAGLEGARTMIVTKSASGQRTCTLEPSAPTRDLTHRQQLLALWQNISEHVADALAQAADTLSLDVETLLAPLRSTVETLSAEVVEQLNLLRSETATELGDAPSEDGEQLLAQLAIVAEKETELTPLYHAAAVLFRRVPTFLFFDDDARNLKTIYAISALRSEVPTALANLLAVAELSLDALFTAIDQNSTSRVTTLERRASDTLGRKFRAAWRQSGIAAAIRIQGDRLEVQIQNVDGEFTSIAERSDGLRQFLALQAFATRVHADQPILLIDEAEQRLHYDAQADLVQMLAKQQVAPKVIYTTHSAGCLPEDLGNGVRLVTPVGGESSEIVNRFWRGEERGVAPLLIGMGASTLAFFPTRRAVMVEGPGDMLVYPTLFREALGSTSLGFQFVPGLSNVNRTMTREALRDEVGVVYLVDGDAGGARIAARLARRGADAADIFVAGSQDGTAVEMEDFIAPDELLGAANRYIEKWRPGAALLTREALTAARQMESLEAAFHAAVGESLPKVDLAYELLDRASSDPSVRLLNPVFRVDLEGIAKSIIMRLDRDRP